MAHLREGVVYVRMSCLQGASDNVALLPEHWGRALDFGQL